MNTRSSGNKSEVENFYKTAIDNLSNLKSSTRNTLYTSTPIRPSDSKSEAGEASINETETLVNISESFIADGSGGSGGVIAQPVLETYGSLKPKFDRTMTTHNPLATLKYAVEAVPFFDGKNIPLNYFIEGCEEAKSMLPQEAESQFTRIIRTRIVGEARRTIQDHDFDSVAQLTKYLKQIYGPSKNIYQLQGELGRIYQQSDEDVVTYANRVKFLGKQIMEAHKNSGNTLPDRDIKVPLEADMCKCFIRGLKPEIEQRIARNLGVQETVADALRIERELNLMTDLRQGQKDANLTNTNRSREICQICYKEGHSASNCKKLTNLGTEILVCQICKKRGHSADKCRFRDPQTRQSVNVLQGNNIVCQLCSKSGHNAKSCRVNNNSYQNKPSMVCQWCEKPGHLANNCWKKQNEQRNPEHRGKIVCRICNNFGHIAKDCRLKLGQNTTHKESLFCRYCKEQGHLLESCALRIASNKRREIHEQGNSDGPSKSGVQQGPEQASHPSTSKKAQ